MEGKINVGGKEFQLKSELMKEGVKFPNSDDNTLHNQFKIIVSVNGMADVFKYYGSMADYEAGKQDLTKEDLKWAFRCIIEDGNSGTMNFEEFCDEFGYDIDSRRAERIWNECVNTMEKLIDLGINTVEFSDILNELSEQGIE